MSDDESQTIGEAITLLDAPAEDEATTIDPAIKRERLGLLVDALRSGHYGQLYGTLGRRQRDGRYFYCILGVMVEVAILNGLTGVERSEDTPEEAITYVEPEPGYTFIPARFRASLPPRVSEWYGCEYSWSGTFQLNGKPIDFWNDAAGKTFLQLAAMIEAEYLADNA